MNDYKLAEVLNQKIVDGLMEGYREYLNVRREKSRTMRVSGAYAWVKGNHIDDQVATSCESYGVQSKLAKAGLTWQYLQFKHHDEKILFIVKNARYFDEEQVDQGKDANGKTRKSKMSYMEKLMGINEGIDFGNIKTQESNGSVQLELLEDLRLSEADDIAIASIESEFTRFYIVTYAIDENQLISKISLLMPNPKNNKAYLIDDLIKYVNPSHDIDIDEELKDALSNSVETNDDYNAFKFDIGLNDDSEEKGQES
ncbi:hypothetical protein OR571_13310 [Psychrobacillus sp. NEAU-3TGS]|uniref:spr1630 family ClpXP-sensitive toxin n=1 Tax=Psychrobacillus sp. NEAU-3TGS TaxID=2995412 RepID=UPI0024996547|nr:hypothetical protein [Psychrobacillus sp. NEAU-3TGS]MDI2588066.1 hypothetical protein [Psychrobacillus sp. NEAU-3TGS]